MSLYEFLLFVHILAAATWFGSGLLLQIQAAAWARRRRTRAAGCSRSPASTTWCSCSITRANAITRPAVT